MLPYPKAVPASILPGSMKRQRGVYGLMFALLFIPLICIVGCALDYARMVQFKGDLQNAVDEAALAGASVLNSSSSATNTYATSVATNYFNRAILPASIKVNAPTVTANNSGSGTLPNGNSAYTVKVSASATVANSLFALLIPSVSISASGTAAEPLVSSNLSVGGPNSQACDQNNLYIYLVPKTADGTGYDYSTAALNLLPASAFTLVTPGATIPPVPANQPLGIKLVNNTDAKCGGTAPNSYGAPGGSTQSFYSSLLANGQSPNADSSNSTTPSGNSNSTYPVVVTSVTTSTFFQTTSSITKIVVTPQGASPVTYTTQPLTLASYTGNAQCVVKSSVNGTTTSNGFTSTTPNTTTYACTTQYATTTNCSLYVQTGVTSSYAQNLNGTSEAPAGSAGKCSSPTTGTQYAAPTCSQLSALANTGFAPAAVFWWNDEGGSGTDDYDYNDAYFAATCSTSGGTASAPGNTEVVLTQ